jgi:hypothetical protein
MVLCATCRVNTIDRHCTNTPRSCYQCCTSHADILTCPLHFQQMGISDAAARLASGRVHANIAEDAEAGLPSVPVPPPAPPGGESPPPGSSIPAQPVADSSAASSPVVVAPVLPVVVPPSLTLSSVAASVVDVAASVVDVAASVAEIRASLAAISAAVRPQAAQAAAPAPAAHAAEPLRASPAPSPPHQAAVLDRAAATARSEVAQLVNRFSALANDDDSDDEAQVRQQSHTSGARSSPTALLPAAFVPTPSGTEQSAQQQLAAIVNGLSKQGSKVKYASVAELDEALDDWATDSIKAGWSANQIQSIRAYQQLLIAKFTVSQRRPLKEVLDYHRRWCKAVNEGDIDMFAKGAELNHAILYDVDHPRQYGGGSTSASPAHKVGKSKDTPAAAKVGTASGSPAPAKHPAGSCTNHPASTSHTTAECKKK